MGKLAFTKLNLKPNNVIKHIEFNGQNIEVKQYLSIEEKTELINNVLKLSYDDENNFANPIKIKVFSLLEIIEKYTNINFTEKQKENFIKLYDLMMGTGLIDSIVQAIPEDEYNTLLSDLYKTIESVCNYRNSILGILNVISQDYSNLNFEANEIQNLLNNPDSLTTLKDIMSNLG